jgi:hypothetical protein
MRGFISEFGWTAFLLIAVVFIVIIGLIGVGYFHYRNLVGNPISSSIQFVSENNRQYPIAATLSHMLAGDRQFMEHATEIIATGSAEGASSQDLDVFVKDLLRNYDAYNYKFVSVGIKKGGDYLFYVDNIPRKCGDDLSGYCVERLRETLIDARWNKYNAGCTDGRVKIADAKYTNEAYRCKSVNDVCCVEGKTPTTNFWPPGTKTCGKAGVEEGNIDTDDPGVCDYIGGGCSLGRIKIPDVANECTKFTEKHTPFCCVPLREDILVETGLGGHAEIPVTYKNINGTVEVTVA